MATRRPYVRIPTTRAESTAWHMPDALVPERMVTLVGEVDATAILRLRDQIRSREGTAPSYTSVVIKAAAATLKKNPEANRGIYGPPGFRRLIEFENIDISVAVEKSLPGIPGQAFAGTILHPLSKPLHAITRELSALATCTEQSDSRFRTYMRILRFVPRPLSNWLINLPCWFPSLWVRHRGCACWVNSPARYGADLVITDWPWPISFSFGIVKKRPWVVDDQIQARPTMPVLMQFDRRIMGGGPASRIFAQFQALLENAECELSDEPK